VSGKLVEIDEARRIVLDSAALLDEETVDLHEALGRALRHDLIAAEPVPAFANSAMDGFAVRADDLRGASPAAPVALTLTGESRAGHPASSGLGVREAIAISTGALLPAGADAVVRLEDTRAAEGRVLVRAEVAPGAEVRAMGEDVTAGKTVLRRGDHLGPAELGVLASLGHASVACTRRARISILTTGDELVAPTVRLAPGQVRNANAYSLPALSRSAGGVVEGIAHALDSPDATRSAIAKMLSTDVAVVCGGVSVGAHDHVKSALMGLEVRERFWGIALRPGKPTWFGMRDRTLVFGLPGNPVSAVVTFILFVAPAIRALAGISWRPARETATLTHSYDKRPGRAHAVRCRLRRAEGRLQAEPTAAQGSHILTSMLGADALAIIPAASGPVRSGEQVEIEPLAPWLGWSA
jgi:molybdopterin molybdotransferase